MIPTKVHALLLLLLVLQCAFGTPALDASSSGTDKKNGLRRHHQNEAQQQEQATLMGAAAIEDPHAEGILVPASNMDKEHAMADAGASAIFDLTKTAGDEVALIEDQRHLAGDDDGSNSSNVINIAVIMDTNNFVWVPDLTEAVFALLNDNSNGWHDDLFPNGETLRYTLVPTGCDATAAMRGYWDVRSDWNANIHAILGCRCSSASMAVANIAGLEGVPQLSPVSTSAQLSDTERFPYFSRLAAPDDARGQVGALVAMLQDYGWKHLNMIRTNTDYSAGLANEFRSIWESAEVGGTIGHEGTPIDLVTRADTGGKTVNATAACEVLKSIPPKSSDSNSRLLLIFAHTEHAYEILKVAFASNSGKAGACSAPGIFPELVYICPEMRGFPNDVSWIPDVPGVLSIVPYQNDDEVFQTFLKLLNRYRRTQQGFLEEWQGLPDYGAYYMVDTIVAIAMTLSTLTPDERKDGQLVTSTIRAMTMDGVSGQIEFTEEGDRRDPQYIIYNLKNSPFYPYATEWSNIGQIQVNSAGLGESKVTREAACFPEVPCGEVIADSFPVPSTKEPNKALIWSLVALGIVGLLLVAVTAKYWRSRKAKQELKNKVSIDSELVGLNETVDNARLKKAELIGKRAQLQSIPPNWDQTSRQTLNEIPPTDKQYWMVHKKLRDSMPDVYITKLWRVQNLPLWTYYSFHKDRLDMHGIQPREKLVWHGTSSLDPEIVYNDQQDGFMMQFAKEGFWGRGIYFAQHSEYADCYSYKPYENQANQNGLLPFQTGERDNAKRDERELFLAKLLVGNAFFIDRHKDAKTEEMCKSLTAPPVDSDTNMKYNTVTGRSAGSKIWVVYENGRAYPEILVRYYHAPQRDPQRTPFVSHADALNHIDDTGNEPDDPSIPLIDKKADEGMTIPSVITDTSDKAARAISVTSIPSQMPDLSVDGSSDEASDADDNENENDNDGDTSIPIVRDGNRFITRTSRKSSTQNGTSVSSGQSTTSSTDSSGGTPQGIAVWEFNQGTYWCPFSSYHREALENAYKMPTPPKKVILRTADFIYEVDIRTMTQINISHPSRTQREIRRVLVDERTWNEQQNAMMAANV